MKSTTTCPHCQTQFLVTDEQLSQYQGKVRCGHCLNVFNAIDYIVEESLSPKEPVDAENDIETSVEETNPVLEANQSQETNQELNVVTATEIEEVAVEQTIVEEAAVAQEESIQNAFLPEEVPQVEVPIQAPDIQTLKSQDALKEMFSNISLSLDEARDSVPAPEENIQPIEIPMEIQNEVETNNFQEEMAKINEFDYKPEYQYYLEQKKSTSPTYLIIGMVLVLIAVMQCIFYYRHTIAMQLPATKPYLESICHVLGCKINLPKEIDLFSIDDSGIEEDPNYQGVIRLSSTLTNRADFNQAYPNLEVTLTDTQDQPKVRRIFKPNEYLPKETKLEEGVPAGDSIAINMPLMADDVKVAGFRVLLTY